MMIVKPKKKNILSLNGSLLTLHYIILTQTSNELIKSMVT